MAWATQASRNSAASVQSKYRYRSAVSFRTSTFLDEVHQGTGMRAQRVAVGVDPVEHDRGDREYHAGRCEFSLRQNVTDQAAVETSVAVVERGSVKLASAASGMSSARPVRNS